MNTDTECWSLIGCGIMIFLIAIGFGGCCYLMEKGEQHTVTAPEHG